MFTFQLCSTSRDRDSSAVVGLFIGILRFSLPRAYFRKTGQRDAMEYKLKIQRILFFTFEMSWNSFSMIIEIIMAPPCAWQRLWVFDMVRLKLNYLSCVDTMYPNQQWINWLKSIWFHLVFILFFYAQNSNSDLGT